jgi:hypothetical protein
MSIWIFAGRLNAPPGQTVQVTESEDHLAHRTEEVEQTAVSIKSILDPLERLVDKLAAAQNEKLFNSGPVRPVAADSHRTEEIKQSTTNIKSIVK